MPPAAGLPRGWAPGGKGERVNRKKWYLVSAVLVAAGMLLFVLPALLGLRPVAALLLERLDRRLPGTLQVEGCSLGWQQPLSCRGLRWDSPQLGLRAEAAAVRGDKGLLALLLAPRYLGELTGSGRCSPCSPPGRRRPRLTLSRPRLSRRRSRPSPRPCPGGSGWPCGYTVRTVSSPWTRARPVQALAREVGFSGSLARGT